MLRIVRYHLDSLLVLITETHFSMDKAKHQLFDSGIYQIPKTFY